MERCCDVVMKGGITSGVVYPLTLVELAKEFQLKNIGGTSAGAIAAAAAAAAELGRGRTGCGFERLAKLPEELSACAKKNGPNQLLAFFQPQRTTQRLFDVGLALLQKGWRGKVRAAGRALLISPGWTLAGAVPGLWLGWLAWEHPNPVARWLGLVAALLGTVAGAALATLYRAARLAVKKLPGNFFGLCTGMDPEGVSDSSQQPLTPWLTDYFDQLAGRETSGRPLIFGDLWFKDGGTAENRTINLEMITSCLTLGRPFRLPFREDELVKENARFHFCEEEFRKFFPARAVDWMKSNPWALPPDSPADAQAERDELAKKGFFPLPAPENLPVVVATRMSLSFPILLSAVPLYAVDYSRKDPKDRVLERCWFSDGGICSNFPLHFFDSPLPRWPTFGINLGDQHIDYEAGVYLPRRRSDGLADHWNRFDRAGGLGSFIGLLGAILSTAKDWTDNTLTHMPGYRDRIALVSLTTDQGGLNLNMPRDRIELLSGFGAEAGRLFNSHFGPTPPEGVELTWANHRVTRLRSSLASIEEMTLQLNHSILNPIGGDPPFTADLITNASGYNWKNEAQPPLADDVLNGLKTLAVKLTGQPLSNGAPRPEPELKVRPRI